MSKTVVIDNGAYTLKLGYSTDKEPKVVPNCVIKAKNVRNRIFIGDQVDDCKDLSGLYYLLAYQKGYLVNWDIQRQVWDYVLGKDGLKVDVESSNLILTEPYYNFNSIQEGVSEILFEDLQFKSVLRCNAGLLAQHKYHRDGSHNSELCCLVVDSGYSFTHIVPYYRGHKLKQGIKRINVGGKVLTNHLKEVISYRQLMVMDETYVMNQVKEDVCYVAQQFYKDMDIGKLKGKENTIVRDYVLPDYTHIKRGMIREPDETGAKAKGSEQIIRLVNERFTIPEVLFHPSDIGIQEMGVAEAIIHAIECVPAEMRPHLYQNIVLTGGNCCIPGFKERLYSDVRSMTPDEFDVRVTCSDNPIAYPWEGGAMLAQNKAEFSKLTVTKEEYEEHGYNICCDKFDV